MEYSHIELNDLPDEILLMIFKELENTDVFYSFHGVDKQLNRIIRDPIFTTSLIFVKWSPKKYLNKLSSNVILDRFCLRILPDISIKIKWLHLESSSVKRILRAADYPNLYGLGLYNMKEKTARRLFIDENLSSGIFKKQITRLIITTVRAKNDLLSIVKMCSRIFSVFNNLTHLMFSGSDENFVSLLFDFPCRSFSSSNLLSLNIKVQSFSQLIYLVDGRFSQLHTLIVDLINPCGGRQYTRNLVKMPTIKWFVLSCAYRMWSLDEFILPLVYRMSNLEKLELYLTIDGLDGFIDGNYLKNILNCMPQLNVFLFDIHSIISINNEINFPSKEDIQRTFNDFQSTKIICCVDYFPGENLGQCHVYSYPSQTKYYQNITNHFPGGIFKYVRLISLHDEHPFEHDFFIRICQSFPFVENISLINHRPQKHKQSDDNLLVVKYNYLNKLNIKKVHDDYLEEFLFNTKTYVHNNICVQVNYESLERVTYNFTRDSTRINCTKINEIYLYGEENYSKPLQDYFPYAIIHWSTFHPLID